MARGYDSTGVSLRDPVVCEVGKAVPENGRGLYDTSNGKTSYEAQNGAVQEHVLGAVVKQKKNDKGHSPSAAYCTPEPEQDSVNTSRKPSIAPLPGRLRMYVPPVNFGAIEEGSIYRSGYPKPENYSFLASLNLKTILTLVPEKLPADYLEFMHENGIRHVQIHIPANKDGKIHITPERMCMALSVVLDRKHHPILVHCNRGKHRTGCVTACLRKVQSMGTERVIAEYRDYSYPKCRDDDMAFIKSFNPLALLPYAQSHGWPVTPPPEPIDDLWQGKKNTLTFSLEDMAACKVPEEPDQSL